MVQSYRDLIVWQKAMDLVEETYKLLRRLPKAENYALSDQMRRAAVSIPSNIAEGYSRGAKREYSRFLTIARGSAFELQTQLMICNRLNYLSSEDVTNAMRLSDEIARMLYSIIIKLQE